MPDGTVFRKACEENRMAILANISKSVTSTNHINVISLLAIRGLCSESSQTVYMSLGILSNLSNNNLILPSTGLLAAILGTLEDFLEVDITFICLSCNILKNLYSKSKSNQQIDSSVLLNLVSILQDISDEESSVEILNNLLNNVNKDLGKMTAKKWKTVVVPIALDVLGIIGNV